MHRRSLERFPFDSVLLPYSYVQMRDERYAADFEALAIVCAERGVAVQTIKAISLAPWDGREQTAATWYEPLREQEDIDLAVHWVLGRPGVFLNTAGDVTLLPRVLDAASRFDSRPSNDAMDALDAPRASFRCSPSLNTGSGNIPGRWPTGLLTGRVDWEFDPRG